MLWMFCLSLITLLSFLTNLYAVHSFAELHIFKLKLFADLKTKSSSREATLGLK